MNSSRSFKISAVFLVGVLTTDWCYNLLLAQNSPPDPEQMFRQLDVNEDGKITLDEQRGVGQREFAQRVLQMGSKPANGSVNRDEFLKIAEQHRNGGRPQGPGGNRGPGLGQNGPRPNGGRPPRTENGESEDRRSSERPDGMPPGLPPFLRGIDENGDHRFSRAELRRLAERFEEIDTNGDGELDIPELTRISDSADRSSKPDEGTSSIPAANNREADPKSRNDGNRSSEGSGASAADKRSRTKPSSGSSAGRKSELSSSGAASGPRSRQPLHGVWRGWVVDGRGENPNAGHMEMELTIQNDQMSARELGENRRAPQGLGEGTFNLSAQGNSGNLDAHQTAGQNAGRDYPGIFQIDGDTLKWCVSGRGRNRPAEFETSRGNYLMVLRKQN